MHKPTEHQEAAMRPKSSLNSCANFFLSTGHLTLLSRLQIPEVITAEELLQISLETLNNPPFFYLAVALT